MSTILKAGIVLGVAVAILSLIYGFGGFYKDATMSSVFPLFAMLIQIAVLVWGLTLTAREGRRYGGQVAAGLLISLVGGVIIIAGSLLFTSVLFPDSTEVAIELQTERMLDGGLSQEAVDDTLEKTKFFYTPVAQALTGFVGTMVTGLVVSLIAAFFIRRKD